MTCTRDIRIPGIWVTKLAKEEDEVMKDEITGITVEITIGRIIPIIFPICREANADNAIRPRSITPSKNVDGIR